MIISRKSSPRDVSLAGRFAPPIARRPGVRRATMEQCCQSASALPSARALDPGPTRSIRCGTEGETVGETAGDNMVARA